MIQGFDFERNDMKQEIPFDPVAERRILLSPTPFKSKKYLKNRLLERNQEGRMKATKNLKVTGKAIR